MKAIIMAGGEGSRLRPLTCDCPKPMLPLMGRPMMEYAIHLLKRHGVSQIAATLGYLPRTITDSFGDGSSLGVSLRYYTEKTPLGTAGSIRRAADFLDERFFVLSGDGITDIDLSAALAFHRERQALATLVLKESSQPQEYGMVVTAPDGRIRAFHEKPGKSDLYSDRINTGIYILERQALDYIPEGRPFDFGKDLFPLLLERDLPLYGYTAEGYWCDVGDTAAYLQVHLDALEGRIHLPEPEPSENRRFIHPGARIDPGAQIGPGCAIGEGCHVGSGASIKRSVLLPGVQIGENAQLRLCIAGTNSRIASGARLFEGSVVGSRCRIGENAVLSSGVKIWPEKEIAPGECARENIVYGSCCADRFEDGVLILSSPTQTARAVQACIAQLNMNEVLIGCGESGVAQALKHAAISGAMAQGARTLDAGITTLPRLRFHLELMHAGGALLVTTGGLLPLDGDGCRLTEAQQRSILKLLQRQDYPRPFSRETPPLQGSKDAAGAYIASMAALWRADAAAAPKIVLSAPDAILGDARRILERIGLEFCIGENVHAGETGISITGLGERAQIRDAQGQLTEVQRQLALAWTARELGEEALILPNHFTRAIHEICPGARFLPGEDALWMRALAAHSPLQKHLHSDGLYFALNFLSLLTAREWTLEDWRESMPPAWRSQQRIPIPNQSGGRLLHALAADNARAELGGGLRLQEEQGWAWLRPDASGTLRIFAESASMEASRELCDFYAARIRRLLQDQD